MPHGRHTSQQRQKVGRALGTFFHNAWGTVSNVVGDLHKDVQGVFTGVQSMVMGTEANISNISTTAIQSGSQVMTQGIQTAGDTVESVVNTAGGTIESLGESLSMPLLVIGAVAGYLVLSGKIDI